MKNELDSAKIGIGKLEDEKHELFEKISSIEEANKMLEVTNAKSAVKLENMEKENCRLMNDLQTGVKSKAFFPESSDASDKLEENMLILKSLPQKLDSLEKLVGISVEKEANATVGFPFEGMIRRVDEIYSMLLSDDSDSRVMKHMKKIDENGNDRSEDLKKKIAEQNSLLVDLIIDVKGTKELVGETYEDTKKGQKKMQSMLESIEEEECDLKKSHKQSHQMLSNELEKLEEIEKQLVRTGSLLDNKSDGLQKTIDGVGDDISKLKSDMEGLESSFESMLKDSSDDGSKSNEIIANHTKHLNDLTRQLDSLQKGYKENLTKTCAT